MSTILIADDEARIRRLVSDFLKRDGHTIVEAADGKEALNILENRRPGLDMAILDVMMPGMDGFEVLRELREQEHGETHLPVMLLTARAEDADQVRGLEAVRTITSPSRFRRSCWRPACAHCSNEKAASVHRSNSLASCRSMSCAVRSWWRTSRST